MPEVDLKELKRPITDPDLTAGQLEKKPKTDVLSVYPDLVLSTGAKIPQVQFGTYKMKKEECKKSVLSALRMGYRGVDTASVYDNEKEVGEAIKESGISRSSLFIQTKLWRSFTGAGKNGKPLCDAELRKSLKRLGTAYIDIWLMHWPGPGRHLNYPPVRMGMDRPKQLIPGNEKKRVPENWTPELRLETYKYMSKHVSPSGPVRALGVCNFSLRQMKDLVAFCDVEKIPRPALLQNECHPYLISRDIRNYCKEENIVFQAYASLGAGTINLMSDQTVLKVSSELGVTPAQVLLRWSVQHGCSVLPKSVNEERQKTNLDIWGFKLSSNQMDLLDGLDQGAPGQNTMVGWLREHDPDFY